MPDTQFLYWGSQNSINSVPPEESFRYVINNSGSGSNIVFMAHLGDLTEDADPSSFQAVGQAFGMLDEHGAAYSVLAGNHDVSGDDTCGSTPYLQTMGPQRFARSKTFAGADPSGYNTAHSFPCRRTGVAAAGDGLAGLGAGLRVGRPVHQGPPEAAGHPHLARDRRLDL